MNSVAINAGTDDTVANNGSAAQISNVPPVATRRQPKRVASRPAIGIARIDPTPRHNSNKPSVPSSSPARALAYGTSGAHAAMPKTGDEKGDARGHLFQAPGTVVWVLRLVISIIGKKRRVPKDSDSAGVVPITANLLARGRWYSAICCWLAM